MLFFYWLTGIHFVYVSTQFIVVVQFVLVTVHFVAGLALWIRPIYV